MSEKVRNSIIEVARETFARYGFRKTTMDEIAVAARKGKSSLYYYFKSKEEVFQAVVEQEAGILFSKIERSVQEQHTAREKLSAYVLGRMKGFRDFVNYYDALKNDFLSKIEFIEQIRKKHDQKEQATIARILEEGIQSGQFRSLNVNLTARTVVIALRGLEEPYFLTDEEIDIEERLNDLLNILFHGIST
ncbi:TetR/AcrR family transcriptional regulator [Sunxiuqinia sp. sy24]|uniref:TetR/AcrR family transcriptional regulator n=1 Tax=Sunxiuqinia sp. sy24 TaxID=3461495 RepID=UPI0040454BB3